MKSKILLMVFVGTVMSVFAGGLLIHMNDTITQIQTFPAQDTDRDPIILYAPGLMIEKSIDQLIGESAIILLGQVESETPGKWNTSDGKIAPGITKHNISPLLHIYTYKNIVVTEYIKGEQSQNHIQVGNMGGIVGKDSETIDGAPILKLGESYILFLYVEKGKEKELSGKYFVTGGGQGEFHLVNGEAISYNAKWTEVELINFIKLKVSITITPTLTLPSTLPPSPISTKTIVLATQTKY
jgi:hypothetical protein